MTFSTSHAVVKMKKGLALANTYVRNARRINFMKIANPPSPSVRTSFIYGPLWVNNRSNIHQEY